VKVAVRKRQCSRPRLTYRYVNRLKFPISLGNVPNTLSSSPRLNTQVESPHLALSTTYKSVSSVNRPSCVGRVPPKLLLYSKLRNCSFESTPTCVPSEPLSMLPEMSLRTRTTIDECTCARLHIHTYNAMTLPSPSHCTVALSLTEHNSLA
jgi:hypothetical protein